MKTQLTVLVAILFFTFTSRIAQAAAADAKNGVLSGLSVVWTGPAATVNKLTIQPGEGYVAQNQYTGAAVALDASVAANYANGVVRTENQPYYVYLFWDSVASVFVVGLISDKPPTNDGIGPAVLKANNGHAGTGLFLGSFLTDSTKNVVPFVRTGEEVILNHVNGVCSGGHKWGGAGAANVGTLTGTGCTLIDFDSDNGGDDDSCNGTDNLGNILDDPYPATASAMLVDIRMLTNGAGAGATDEIIAPQLPDPTPAVIGGNYQLYFTLPAAGAQAFLSMQRINPVVVALGAGGVPPRAPTSEQFTICQINSPGVGQSVGGYIIYRGYVESIGHLTQD